MSRHRAGLVARSGHRFSTRKSAKISKDAVCGLGLRKLRIEALESRRLLSLAPWVAGPSLPTATTAAAAIDYGGAVDLFGGYHGTQATSAVLQLGYGSSAWTTTTSLNQSRAAGGAGETGFYPNNNGDSTTDIFNFGGVSQGQVTNSASNYTNESTFAPLSAARSFFSYAAAPGNTGSATAEYLYAIGGLNGSNQALRSVERYDAASNTWTTMSPLPLPSGQGLSHTTAAYDGAGHIFVFGGKNSSGSAVNTVYRYTIATDSWDTATQMPAAMSDSSALYAAYGLTYLIGGRTAQGAVSAVWNFDPVLTTVQNGIATPGAWTADAPLPSAVYNAATVIDADGNIDVIGGTNSSGSAVTNVWTTPVGAPPDGLPAYPTLTLQQNGTYYSADTFSYDGTAHGGVAFAYGPDGATPIDGSFTFLYNGSTTPPVNAGTYQLLVHFTSNDPGYVDAYLVGQLEIDPAIPTINVTGGGTFLYDGQPHPISATEVGIDGVTPVAGSLTYSYNGSSTVPLAPGTYSAVATFNSSDPNYFSWSVPQSGSGSAITIKIPDPTIPTNFVSTPTATTAVTLSWNAAWETDANLSPASSYTITEKIHHVVYAGKGSTRSYDTYSTVASGITSTSITISGLTAGSAHQYALNSVNSSGVASPQTAYIVAQTATPPTPYPSLYSNGSYVAGYPSLEVGRTSYFTISFPGNPVPSISMVSGPPTMSFDPSTNVITYSPTASDFGFPMATFRATNLAGSAIATVTFRVQWQPVLVVTGGTFNFGPFDPSFGLSQHPATATAYMTDGVTPLAGTMTTTYAAVPPAIQPYQAAPYGVGTYLVTATFASSDSNYGSATATTTIVINPIAPTIVIDAGPFGNTGAPQAAIAMAINIDGVTPVPGTFSFTYNGSSTVPSLPGTYAVVANFTVDSAIHDYTNATATGTMTILPNGAVTIQSGAVQGGIQGPVSVVKSGPGMATLGGPNSYTGGTYVSGGTLVVTDPTSLPDGGSLTIGWAAAFEPAPIAVAVAVSTAAAVPSNPATPSGASSTATTATIQLDVSVHAAALLVHLTLNNRSATSFVIPLPSSVTVSDLSSGGGENRDHDIALLLHMSLTK